MKMDSHEVDRMSRDVDPARNADKVGDMALLNGLAALYVAYGQFEQARNVLALAHWHDPRDVETLGLAARLALRRGDRARAVSLLREIQRRWSYMPSRDLRLLARLTRNG